MSFVGPDEAKVKRVMIDISLVLAHGVSGGDLKPLRAFVVRVRGGSRRPLPPD